MIVLCGTNRPEANTRKVAHQAEKLLNLRLKELGREPAYFLDLADLKSDIFYPEAYAKKPEWFAPIQTRILEAKGILVITPEYNGSFPGVLKYFIDMLRFPESLVGVPVAFIGVAAGLFGALRSVEQLELIFHYRNAHIFGQRLFVPKINEVITPNGELGPHQERLVSLVGGFADFALKLKP